MVDKINYAFKAIMSRPTIRGRMSDFTQSLKMIGKDDIYKDVAWVLSKQPRIFICPITFAHQT